MSAKIFSSFLSVIVLVLGLNSTVNAQVNQSEFNELKEKVESLQNENSELRSKLNIDTSNLKNQTEGYAPMAMVLFLFGSFCALWAQNTGRNPWFWFFFGLAFSIFTVIVLLINNSREQNS